jgi:hypothetical protein
LAEKDGMTCEEVKDENVVPEEVTEAVEVDIETVPEGLAVPINVAALAAPEPDPGVNEGLDILS